MDISTKEQLIRVMFRFKRLNISFPPEIEISMIEFFLLKGLSGNSPYADDRLHLSDIHSHLHITKPAVSQMLNTLEKKEYIHREIDKNDRRKISITLTPKGQDILKQTKTYMDDMMNMTISHFGEENTKQLVSLLTLLADITEDINSRDLNNH